MAYQRFAGFNSVIGAFRPHFLDFWPFDSVEHRKSAIHQQEKQTMAESD